MGNSGKSTKSKDNMKKGKDKGKKDKGKGKSKAPTDGRASSSRSANHDHNHNGDASQSQSQQYTYHDHGNTGGAWGAGPSMLERYVVEPQPQERFAIGLNDRRATGAQMVERWEHAWNRARDNGNSNNTEGYYYTNDG